MPWAPLFAETNGTKHRYHMIEPALLRKPFLSERFPFKLRHPITVIWPFLLVENGIAIQMLSDPAPQAFKGRFFSHRGIQVGCQLKNDRSVFELIDVMHGCRKKSLAGEQAYIRRTKKRDPIDIRDILF